MTTKSIAVERRGRVQIIAMHRPEHGNRVSQTMAEEIAAALEQSRRDPDIGGCVLTGVAMSSVSAGTTKVPA